MPEASRHPRLTCFKMSQNPLNPQVNDVRSLFEYSSILGDVRLWVGPRKEHLIFSWDLTNPESINVDKMSVAHNPSCMEQGVATHHQPSESNQIVFLNSPHPYHRSPNSGECQYRSRSWKRRVGPSARAGGTREQISSGRVIMMNTGP